MGIRDLREKYGGKNLKSREAVNRAVRAELVGGDDCLDAAESLHFLVMKLRQRNFPGAEDAQQALNHTRRVADILREEIARRYELGGNGEAKHPL